MGWFMRFTRSVLSEAIARAVDLRLERAAFCRHVMGRGVQIDSKGELSPEMWHLRCGEPACSDCQFHYCLEHCREICGVDEDPDDPDEDEVEPEYEPPVVKKSTDVLEAN